MAPLSLLIALAAAQAPEPYPTAVRLIDNLYLEPATLDAGALLREAAEAAADEVPWLFVETDGDEVILKHGDGTAIGRVHADGIDALPERLYALERLLLDSGYPLGGASGAPVDLRLTLLDGMTAALDRYSRVLSGDGLDRFDVRLKGTVVGIGVGLEWQGHTLVVTRVDGGSPAARGGVRVGDHVLRIDGRSTTSMTLADASSYIRGDEGTPVTLTVARQQRNGASETRVTADLVLVREEIVLPNVTHRALAGGVGYVHIEHVSQQTVPNLKAALAALADEGALGVGLVVDLRGNTGGSMKEAARAADVFLESGLLLRTVGHDGGRVQNLEAEMRAIDGGDEPPIPVVLVVDDRTASGAEILAGALLEHQRTVLVGGRTYGKGTVQKIYNLDEHTRLKLTVARYLLANDRTIGEEGLPPDLLVARVAVDDLGVRVDADTRAPRAVVEVVEGGAASDLALEIARRTALSAASPRRADVLAALDAARAWADGEQHARLEAAMARRGAAWTPAPAEGTFPDADVTLRAEPGRGDRVTVHVALTHRGDEPLHRAVVELDSGGLGPWTGWAVPFGEVPPGATVHGTVSVPVRPGAPAREDAVEAIVRADRRPPLAAGVTWLAAAGAVKPEASLAARWVPHAERVGPHGHPVYRAELTVTNHGRDPLHGVELTFAYPDDPRIELLDRAARLPVVAAGGAARADLLAELAPGGALPDLEVQVTAERFGLLVRGPVPVDRSGGATALRAPRVEPPRERVAPAGNTAVELRVRDDSAVRDVVVWVNGAKVHWAPGGTHDVKLRPTLPLRAGANTVAVVARDDQGLRTDATFVIRGDEPTSAAAE